MINFGNNPCTLYLGDKKVTAVYLGDEKVYPSDSLELSPVSLQFAAAGQSLELGITVDAGRSWTIAALPAGFSASTMSGTGPTTVTVTASNNTSEAARPGTLTVSSEGLSAECAIFQAAGQKVYGNWQNVSVGIEKTSFTASGGTSRAWVNVKRSWTWNGVPGSGGEETSESALRSVSSSDSIASSPDERTITVGSLGTTLKATATITISATSNADSNNRVSAIITQDENYISGVNVLAARSVSYNNIPAAGGSATPTWAQYGLDDLWQMVYATGATSSYYHAFNNGWGSMSDLPAGGEAGYDNQNWTYDGGGNFAGINPDTGVISASSKGAVESGVTSTNVRCVLYQKWVNKTGIGPANVYFNGSKGGYATGVCSQAENRRRAVGTSCSGTTLVTAYRWDSGADGGSSSSPYSYDCGYRRTLTIDGMLSPTSGSFRNPSLSVWLVNRADEGPSYSDKPSVYISPGSMFSLTCAASKNYTSSGTPTKAILLLNYEGSYNDISWQIVSAGSGSIISTSGSLCYMDVGAWDSIGKKQIQIRINVT